MSFRLNRPRQFSDPQTSSTDTGPLLKLIDELTKRITELEQKPCDASVVDRIVALEQQDIKVSLKDLTDVDLSNMTDDSTLSYDGATEKWTAVVYESDANAVEEE